MSEETAFYSVYQQYKARAGDWGVLKLVLEASRSWHALAF